MNFTYVFFIWFTSFRPELLHILRIWHYFFYKFLRKRQCHVMWTLHCEKVSTESRMNLLWRPFNLIIDFLMNDILVFLFDWIMVWYYYCNLYLWTHKLVQTVFTKQIWLILFGQFSLVIFIRFIISTR